MLKHWAHFSLDLFVWCANVVLNMHITVKATYEKQETLNSVT